MAGYWPSSFFRKFMDRDGVETQKLAKKKKERDQYPAILNEQTYMAFGLTRQVVPSGQDSSISPARVASHSIGFDSTCNKVPSCPLV